MTRHQDGFTLIELLCALTILALVLGVTLRIFAGGSRSAEATRDYARGLVVVQSHLALLQAADRLTPGQRSGADGDIAWQETVSPAHDGVFAAQGALTAWRLDSEARLANGRVLHLSTVRLERNASHE
jgi:prepilin-type N-terminal cleavage/methylation domain-containing protein